MNQKRSRATRKPTKRSLIGSEYPSVWALVMALMVKEVDPELLTLKDRAEVAARLRYEGWNWVAVGHLVNRAPSTVRESYNNRRWL